VSALPVRSVTQTTPEDADQDRVDAALLVLILTFRVGLRRSEATKLLLADFHMEGNPTLLVRPHAERRLITQLQA